MLILPRKHTAQKPRLGTRLDPTSPFTQGLVFATILNEDAGPPADIVQRNAGVVTGATWAAGDLSFTDGSSNVVKFGTNGAYWPVSGLTATVEFVVPTIPGSTRTIYGSRTAGMASGFLFTVIAAGQISGNIFNITQGGPINMAISAGSRYVVSLTYDGSMFAQYLTNVATGATTISTVSVSGSLGGFTSGEYVFLGDDGTPRSFGGTIRRALIYNRALSASEIDTIHRQPSVMFQSTAMSRAIQRGAINLGTWNIVNGLFGESGTRNPISYSRTATESLFSEGPPPGTNLGARTASDTIFAESTLRNTALQRSVQETLFTETAYRPPVAPAPYNALPYDIPEPALFTESASRTIVFPRTILESLFAEAASRTMGGMTRSVMQSALFTQSATCTGVQPGATPGSYNPSDPFAFSRQWQTTIYAIRSLPMLASKLLIILDGWSAAFRQTDMAACSTRIAQSQVNVVGGDGTSSTVYGTGDEKFINLVGPTVDSAVTAALPDTVNKSVFSPMYSSLTSWLQTSDGGGYASLDAYCTAQNTASRNSFLVAPSGAYEYFLYTNKNLMLSPTNVFAPLTTLGTATVGAAGAITYTHGSSIPSVNNVPGGVQGYTPSLGINCLITTTINGTLTIQVTYDGQTSTGTPFTGHTVNIVLDNATTGSTITTNPLPSDERINNITAVVQTGTPTASTGAFTLNSILERVIS